MYEHFRPSERIFVDRETHLSWMSDALTRCKEKSIVLHIRGIGGIGKSSLLEHWHSTIEKSILLDCSHTTDFYNRLDAIAKGAVRFGIKLSRFDVLWSIRQRFVQGVEPAKEAGRSWALEILAPLPFIGSLTGIGTAIRTISERLSPKLSGKYGNLGSWLQSRLGRNYLEELLELLWKEPRHAEFLYLDALLEDISNRKDLEQPILIALDSFDSVDDSEPRWNYRGRKITEVELWCVFLSSLVKSVGVVASRRSLPKSLDTELDVEVTELKELDDASCRQLLTERELTDEGLQQKIVEVSFGNPFIVDTICDIFSMGGLSSNDFDSLKANTLEEVRLASWRKLFSQVKDLEPIIERAGLLPYFDRHLLETIIPALKTYHWNQLTRFSFMKERGDGTWELHDLAKELIITELGRQLDPLVEEVSGLLEKEAKEENNLTLLGLAFSVEALISEENAILKTKEVVSGLIKKESIKAALEILDSLFFDTIRGKAVIHGLRGWALYFVHGYAEAEASVRDAIDIFKDLAEKDFATHGDDLALFTGILALIMQRTLRYSDAEDTLMEAIQILSELRDQSYSHEIVLGNALNNGGAFYLSVDRVFEAITSLENATSILGNHPEHNQIIRSNYALSLCNLAIAYRRDGRINESYNLYVESIGHLEEIMENIPIRFKQSYATTLNNYSLLLKEMDSLEEAESSLSRAIEIEMELVEDEPQVYEPRLAALFNNQGIIYSLRDDLSKAEEAFSEAIELRRGLIEKSPEMNQDGLAACLHNMGILLRKSGRLAEAESAQREALEILEGLKTRAPDFFTSRIAKVLHNLRITLQEGGDKGDDLMEIQGRLSVLGFEVVSEELWEEEEEPAFCW